MTIQYDKNGILTQNFTEILDERERSLKPVLGDDFIVDKTSPIGNMELADTNNELAIHELLAWIFPNQLDANTAEGVFLDAICEKNRIYRKQPEYTKINFIIKGTPNTSFIVNDITVSDSITGIYYNLNEDVTIGVDGSVSAQFICQIFGEFYPLENSTLKIETPFVGLDSVEINIDNPNISLGRLTETDDELRTRRMYSVQQTSTTTTGSILGNLYSLSGVLHATYLENYGETTDSNGVPLKSFEFIVDGGDENEITDVIFVKKNTGTRAFGSTIIEKRDSQDNLYAIGYTKAQIINTGININIDMNSLPSELWINKVKESIKQRFDTIQDIGVNVKDYNYYTVLTSFPEILDITGIQIYDKQNEEQKYTNMPINIRQVAKLNTENISININIE